MFLLGFLFGTKLVRVWLGANFLSQTRQGFHPPQSRTSNAEQQLYPTTSTTSIIATTEREQWKENE
ncbi:hypothetical protein LR48_Vigan10g122200 [Vigna angularis]|uniref:Secreted protein n=1 Tax=Phaseolus angularis TaxID=3914 RepID=A0A0L9VJV2_PHAAN|nr:hypothetical protein LR48_Vigan10g122200 [Vigna angularis]